MITLLVGFIIGGVLLGLIVKDGFSGNKTYILGVLLAATVTSMILILTSPVEGYYERILAEEVEISVCVLEGEISEEKQKYLLILEDGKYEYRQKGEDKNTVVHSKITPVKYYQLAEYNNPVVRVYETKAKYGWFTFCTYTKTDYEFYLPEDSVLQ